jgi:hypothetical protein
MLSYLIAAAAASVSATASGSASAAKKEGSEATGAIRRVALMALQQPQQPGEASRQSKQDNRQGMTIAAFASDAAADGESAGRVSAALLEAIASPWDARIDAALRSSAAAVLAELDTNSPSIVRTDMATADLCKQAIEALRNGSHPLPLAAIQAAAAALGVTVDATTAAVAPALADVEPAAAAPPATNSAANVISSLFADVPASAGKKRVRMQRLVQLLSSNLVNTNFNPDPWSVTDANPGSARDAGNAMGPSSSVSASVTPPAAASTPAASIAPAVTRYLPMPYLCRALGACEHELERLAGQVGPDPRHSARGASNENSVRVDRKVMGRLVAELASRGFVAVHEDVAVTVPGPAPASMGEEAEEADALTGKAVIVSASLSTASARFYSALPAGGTA